jgi:antitoxin component of RelBE/YafQ-DinJ toxin-antitoxin module
MEGNMQQAELTVSIDKDLKESGEALIRSLGTSWSAAFSAFVIYSVKRGKIPEIDESEPEGFVFSKETEEQDPFFNRATQAELHRRIAEAEADGDEGWIDYEALKKQAANV